MFRLSFETNDAVFEDDGAFEVARILGDLRDRVLQEAHGSSREAEGVIRDVNGNSIGAWFMEIGDE